jgi:hypothetical protein
VEAELGPFQAEKELYSIKFPEKEAAAQRWVCKASGRKNLNLSAGLI